MGSYCVCAISDSELDPEPTNNTGTGLIDGESILKRWDYSKALSFWSFYLIVAGERYSDSDAEKIQGQINNVIDDLNLSGICIREYNETFGGEYLFDGNMLDYDGSYDVSGIVYPDTDGKHPCLFYRVLLSSRSPLSDMIKAVECLEGNKDAFGIVDIRPAPTLATSGGMLTLDVHSSSHIKDDSLYFWYGTERWKKKWYLEPVQYVLFNQIMNGYAAVTPESKGYSTIVNARDIGTCFRPNETATRAQTAQVFYNMYGAQPVEGVELPFTDVGDKWYYDAIAWAYENDIVNGMSETEFCVDTEITREQFVTMLYRYAQYCGEAVTETAELSTFGDADMVSEYAKDALSWAVSKGYLKGTEVEGVTLLNPLASITRAEMAALLMRYDRAQ